MAYRDVIVADNPTSYWRLGDTDTVMRDWVGTNPGSYSGAGIVKGSPGLIVGDPDKCLLCSASNTSSVPRSTAFDITQTRTVECWMKCPSGSAPFMFASGSNSNLGGWVIGVNLTNHVNIDLYSSAAAHAALTTTLTLANNSINHIVGIMNPNGTGKIYVNGALQPLSSAGGGITVGPNTNAPMFMGQNSVNTFLDEVAFYPVELGADEVSRHYQAGIYNIDLVGGISPVSVSSMLGR